MRRARQSRDVSASRMMRVGSSEAAPAGGVPADDSSPLSRAAAALEAFVASTRGESSTSGAAGERREERARAAAGLNEVAAFAVAASSIAPLLENLPTPFSTGAADFAAKVRSLRDVHAARCSTLRELVTADACAGRLSKRGSAARDLWRICCTLRFLQALFRDSRLAPAAAAQRVETACAAAAVPSAAVLRAAITAAYGAPAARPVAHPHAHAHAHAHACRRSHACATVITAEATLAPTHATMLRTTVRVALVAVPLSPASFFAVMLGPSATRPRAAPPDADATADAARRFCAAVDAALAPVDDNWPAVGGPPSCA